MRDIGREEIIEDMEVDKERKKDRERRWKWWEVRRKKKEPLGGLRFENYRRELSWQRKEQGKKEREKRAKWNFLNLCWIGSGASLWIRTPAKYQDPIMNGLGSGASLFTECLGARGERTQCWELHLLNISLICMKIRHCREQYKALVGQRCIWLASSTWWCEMIELVTGR